MEYLGRRVRKKLQGHSTLSGSIEDYEPATGLYKIVYSDGVFESLKLSELDFLLELPSPMSPEFYDGSPTSKRKKRRLVDNNEGTYKDNSMIAGDLIDKVGYSGAFDLNLKEELSDDADGGCEVRGGVKLDVLESTDVINLELDEVLDLNKMVAETSTEVKPNIIDLNLVVCEDINDRLGKGFDLNLQLMENEVPVVDDHEGKFIADDKVTTVEYVQKMEEIKNHDAKRTLENVDDDVISNIDNGGENTVKNEAFGVDNGNVVPLTALKKKRGRKRKETVNNNVELATQVTEKVDVAESMKLELESKDETPLKKCSESVDAANGISGSEPRLRSRKRRELLDNTITSSTPDMGLRRSSRRAKRATVSSQDHVFSAAGLEYINHQLYSPGFSALSDEEDVETSSRKSAEHAILPPKVELPPPSSNLDLDGVPMFDLVSVYAFLRSFSTMLFLSPFGLDDFVASIRCDDSTLLFDSIHFSLMRTLRKHLVSLSNEGCVSASECLRSLNWDFLDLITWPMFVVEYLLLHSPGYIPGLNLRQLKPFSRDYYKMPVSAKCEILRHICDDMIEVETFRSELNRRTLATEQNTDFDWDMKFDSSRKRKVVMEVANTSCITEENVDETVDPNSDECCLCKMDGNLICCDGCPAAFHSRCVGVVSSLLPEGDWYCPECSIEKDKPWMKVGKSIRGAELLGIDPYGRLYYSSCGFLLVLESSNDEYKCSCYNRNDLPTVIRALELPSFLSDTIISAICRHWNIEHVVDGTRNYPDGWSYSSKHPASSDTLYKDEVVAGEKCDDKTLVTACSSSLEHCPEIPDDSRIPMKLQNTEDLSITSTSLSVEQGGHRNFMNHRYALFAISSGKHSSQVHCGPNYVNCYEFARTASSAFEELSYKSSDKISKDAPRTIEEIIAGQMKVVSNWFSEFSWSNIQSSNVDYRKEKCGWCFYCKVPEEEMDCLFIRNDIIPVVENFTSNVLGIKVKENRENHLIDIMCHMICIEDHLQGLLVGPWLNSHYSVIWRKSVVGVEDIAALKILLLKLESNLHYLALSADWRKHVDSVALMGSASHITARASSKQKKSKCSELGISPSPNTSSGLLSFWWRGGRGSRKLFNWKVLPRNSASKAARQGGCKKIPGIQYPENGEYAKRTKDVVWRAAVETSRSTDQLALQIRELSANIRWHDIGNTNVLPKIEKDSKKPVRSFKKVVVRRKCCEGTAVRYLLDFGKRRFIPDIVMKHGSVVEDLSSVKKKYWLEESHVPLHLLKAFEEKRIARKSNPKSSEKLHEISRAKNPFKKEGFSYLFSRAERPETYQCGHCNKDVVTREAVSCQYCKGFFHKRHAQKSTESVTAECIYTCHKCRNGNLVKIDATRGPKHKNASKRLKTGKKARKQKQQIYSKIKKRVPLVVEPLRRSARYAERTSKLSSKNIVVKKRKKRKQAKSRNGKLKKPDNNSLKKTENSSLKKTDHSCLKKKRTCLNSSYYWLNGLQISRKTNDERLLDFKIKKLLVLSEDATSADDIPKCSLCGELEYSSKLSYLACETCGVWFHGDALGLRADKIENLIGFKCHECLNKMPPICPHQQQS